MLRADWLSYFTGLSLEIGLQIIVDAEVLSREIIEAAIADFCAKGEVNWLSPEPARIEGLSNVLHCNLIT